MTSAHKQIHLIADAVGNVTEVKRARRTLDNPPCVWRITVVFSLGQVRQLYALLDPAAVYLPKLAEA